jgi:hypothetical protein
VVNSVSRSSSIIRAERGQRVAREHRARAQAAERISLRGSEALCCLESAYRHNGNSPGLECSQIRGPSLPMIAKISSLGKMSSVFKEFLDLEDPNQCAENSEQLPRAEAGVVRGPWTRV